MSRDRAARRSMRTEYIFQFSNGVSKVVIKIALFIAIDFHTCNFLSAGVQKIRKALIRIKEAKRESWKRARCDNSDFSDTKILRAHPSAFNPLHVVRMSYLSRSSPTWSKRIRFSVMSCEILEPLVCDSRTISN